MMSKAMTYLLRHGAIKEGVPIGGDGFILVSDVLNWLNSKYTEDDIRKMVDDDKKTRFSIAEGPFRIRANQGHSIELSEQVLQLYTKSGQILHCTKIEHQEAIRSSGLKPMSRTHVHMIQLGSWHLVRPTSDLYVFVDTDAARTDGIEFFISDNYVVLCPGTIPAKYLTFVPAHPQGKKSACYGFIVRAGKSICYVRTPQGQWGFPKGKRNKDELPIACALRELCEETSLHDIRIMDGSITEITDKGSSPTTYYYAISNNVPLKCKNSEELAETVWLDAPPIGLRASRLCLILGT
jgi:2'-phosphotransferase